MRGRLAVDAAPAQLVEERQLVRAIEAQAFGFLAARGLKGLPLSYPATTGVPIPMTGGIMARP